MKARHERALSRLALVLLALIAELVGHSLARRIDVGRHVGRVSYANADYYPLLVAAVKVGAALMLARVAWRFAKARRLAGLLRASPRVRVELSARLWLASFAATSLAYLAQTNVSALIHTSALPVFAVLSVLVALLHRGVEQWLREYERLAANTIELVRHALVQRAPHVVLHLADGPRRRFGLAFESRPPPVPA